MGQIVEAVAASDRGVAAGGAAAVRAAVDEAPFGAAAAVSAGLFDGLAWRDEMPAVVRRAVDAREASRPAAAAAAAAEWTAARAALAAVLARRAAADADAEDAASGKSPAERADFRAALGRMLDAHGAWMEVGGGLPAAPPAEASAGERGGRGGGKATPWDARARSDWTAEHRAVVWMRRLVVDAGDELPQLPPPVLAFLSLVLSDATPGALPPSGVAPPPGGDGREPRLLLPRGRDGPGAAVAAALAARRDAAMAPLPPLRRAAAARTAAQRPTGRPRGCTYACRITWWKSLPSGGRRRQPRRARSAS